MTTNKSKSQTTLRSNRAKAPRFCGAYACILLTVLFLKSSSTAALWISRGLSLCAKTLLPSLFPFMVFSSLLISLGASEASFGPFGKLSMRLFGLRACCAQAILLGWLCGFPIGAVCADSLYRSEQISREERNRALCICGAPSPAFLISAVGESMLGSKGLGIALYAISLTSSIVLGIFLRIALGIPQSSKTVPSSSISSKRSFAFAFTEAISSSAIASIRICAFVVFFCALIGVLGEYLSLMGASSTVGALIFSALELTFGLSELSSLGERIRLPLCALAVGWSGMSVHLQTMAIVGGKEGGADLRAYLLSHAARALICLALALLANALLL